MIIRIRFGNWRSTFSIAPVTDVIGVNSTLPNGNHIAMWDFDDVTIDEVKLSLRLVQIQFNLPNIYIMNTGTPKHYIAYSFVNSPWERVVMITAATPFIDRDFFKYGVYRGYFTLRVTPKNNRKITHAYTLMSGIPEAATIKDLNEWRIFETVNWDDKTIFKCRGCKSPLRHCISLGGK